MYTLKISQFIPKITKYFKLHLNILLSNAYYFFNSAYSAVIFRLLNGLLDPGSATIVPDSMPCWREILDLALELKETPQCQILPSHTHSNSLPTPPSSSIAVSVPVSVAVAVSTTVVSSTISSVTPTTTPLATSTVTTSTTVSASPPEMDSSPPQPPSVTPTVTAVLPDISLSQNPESIIDENSDFTVVGSKSKNDKNAKISLQASLSKLNNSKKNGNNDKKGKDNLLKNKKNGVNNSKPLLSVAVPVNMIYIPKPPSHVHVDSVVGGGGMSGVGCLTPDYYMGKTFLLFEQKMFALRHFKRNVSNNSISVSSSGNNSGGSSSGSQDVNLGLHSVSNSNSSNSNSNSNSGVSTVSVPPAVEKVIIIGERLFDIIFTTKTYFCHISYHLSHYTSYSIFDYVSS